MSFTTGGSPRGGVIVSRAADPPDLPGPPSVRFVAPGSATDGRYGLFEYTMGPHSPGPAPHFHRTFSESFYVLTGELTILADDSWTTFGAGDYALVPEHGVHAFRNDGDAPVSFLILFAPGIARERFFTELAQMREQGVELTPEERVAFYARHDQVNLDQQVGR